MGDLVGQKAAAAHASVDGEVGAEGIFAGKLAEVGDFIERAEARCPRIGGDFRAFVGNGGAEEINGALQAGFGEAARFVGVRHAEKGKVFLFQSARKAGESVAVGIGFDDAHDVLTAVLAGVLEIVTKGAEVDFGPSARRGHGELMKGTWKIENGKMGCGGKQEAHEKFLHLLFSEPVTLAKCGFRVRGFDFHDLHFRQSTDTKIQGLEFTKTG